MNVIFSLQRNYFDYMLGILSLTQSDARVSVLDLLARLRL